MPSLPQDKTIIRMMEVCIGLTRSTEMEQAGGGVKLSTKAIQIKTLLDKAPVGINEPLSKLFSIFLGEEVTLSTKDNSPYKHGLMITYSDKLSESEFKPGSSLLCLRDDLPCMLRDNGHLRSVDVPHDGPNMSPHAQFASDDEIKAFFYECEVRAEKDAVIACLQHYCIGLI